jgi:hypothetical protein
MATRKAGRVMESALMLQAKGEYLANFMLEFTGHNSVKTVIEGPSVPLEQEKVNV